MKSLLIFSIIGVLTLASCGHETSSEAPVNTDSLSVVADTAVVITDSIVVADSAK